MHKSTIIQLVLIIIGIVSFFNGIELLLGDFVNLVMWLSGENSNKGFFDSIALLSLLISCSYFLLAYFFIVRSGRWSKWITKKARLSSGFTAHAAPAELLYILFVITGSYMLLRELPRFLNRVFAGFAYAVARNHETGLPADPRSSWTLSLLNILIPVLTIFLAKNLARYFAGKTATREELSITDEPGQDVD